MNRSALYGLACRKGPAALFAGICLALALALAPPCPAQTASAQPQTAKRVYVVRAGDTWNSIAQARKLDPAHLARHNGLTPQAPLRPGQTLSLPAPAKAQAAKAQTRDSIAAEVAPKSAWETMTEDPNPPMPGLVGQAPGPAAPPQANLPVTPETRPPADTVPAPKAPTQDEPRTAKRQSIGVRANIISKGSTKVTGVVSPVETPGQSGSGGAGAGVILRHEF